VKGRSNVFDYANAKVIQLKVSPLLTLIGIANMGAYSKSLETTTSILGKKLGLSQQTASRRLGELEKLGWITKERTLKGQGIRISKEGVEVLRSVYGELRGLFEGELASLEIEGIVFSGMRDGAYYVTQEGYRKQFMEKLGFNPYPGTLNLKLKTALEVQAKRILDAYPGIMIDGFEDGQRTFGSVKSFKAIINNKTEGAILLIKRTHHGENVIEIISPYFLREKLGLKDGDRVGVKILINRK
jgi:riboflavin kinase